MTRTLQAELLAYLRTLKEEGVAVLPNVPPRKGGAAPVPAVPAVSVVPPAPRRAGNGTNGTDGTKRRNDETNGMLASAPLLRASAPPRELSSLSEIAAAAAACRRCGLCAARIQVVPGQGNPNEPEVMFVGEGPGADEDAQGLAFVGRSGKLLTQMIEAMGLTRDAVFIANVVKCRPPGNRKPTPEEMDACLPFLRRQIQLVRPRVIVTLGATAAQGLVGEMSGVNAVHGQWREFDGIPVLLSFHPAYLLRDPRKKRDAWSDLKAVLARLGRPVPGR